MIDPELWKWIVFVKIQKFQSIFGSESGIDGPGLQKIFKIHNRLLSGYRNKIEPMREDTFGKWSRDIIDHYRLEWIRFGRFLITLSR